MPHARRQFGDRGEALAATYLEQRGYRVIGRNIRTPVGELDLVCIAPCPPKPCSPIEALAKLGRRGEVVFVEVKTRRSAAYGHPEEAVTRTKQQHLMRAAHVYLAQHAELRGRPYRIDVIAITGRTNGPPDIVHIPHAVGEA